MSVFFGEEQNKNKLFGVVYKATNKINGMGYIGQTTQQPFERRRKAHLKDAERGSGIYFHRAIRKYGEENFIFEIIACCCDQESLSRTERALIKQHNTRAPWGYNLTEGGEGCAGYVHSEETKAKKMRGRKWSDESRAKMSAAKTGTRHSDETRAKMRAAKSATSDETRAKMSAARRGKKRAAPQRGVLKGGWKQNPIARGVRASGKYFTAHIYIAGKQIHLGSFSTLNDAKKAYEAADAARGPGRRGRGVRNQSPEARAAASARQTERMKSPELRAKIAAEQTERMKSPEAREKVAAAHRGKKRSPESISKQRATCAARAGRPTLEVRTRLLPFDFGAEGKNGNFLDLLSVGSEGRLTCTPPKGADL